MKGITEERRIELAEVVVALNESFGTITDSGVKIVSLCGLWTHGVGYRRASDDNTITEMSPTAYAAEFYKVCGNSLDTATLDVVLPELLHVGGALGKCILESYESGDLSELTADEARVIATEFPIGDGGYR